MHLKDIFTSFVEHHIALVIFAKLLLEKTNAY